MIPKNAKELIRYLETLGFKLKSHNKHYKLTYKDGTILCVSGTPKNCYGYKSAIRDAKQIILAYEQGRVV